MRAWYANGVPARVIYGINAVVEALRSRGRSIQYVAVARERRDDRVQGVIEAARTAGVMVRLLPREQVSKVAGTDLHQGVVAVGGGRAYADLDELLEHRRGEFAFVAVLDGIEDPHNLGAILRTADAAGADGVVIPERRAAGVTGAVAKASAGASEHVRIARVTNIARTLDDLKQRNVWIVGLDERGDRSYDAVDFRMDCALVLGAEGRGLHDLVRRKCDFVVSIPMLGEVPSLNVSVAAGVVMYEMVRQRRGAKK